jgi:hypothetical protein
MRPVNEGRISQVLCVLDKFKKLIEEYNRQRRTDFSGIVVALAGEPLEKKITRQRRTDFSGIVGLAASFQRRWLALAVNAGRISQVLWAGTAPAILAKVKYRQRRTDFSGIVGSSTGAPFTAVNGGRISQVLWGA